MRDKLHQVQRRQRGERDAGGGEKTGRMNHLKRGFLARDSIPLISSLSTQVCPDGRASKKRVKERSRD